MAGCTPRSQGKPSMASIAKGSTQKSHTCTTPGANSTRTLCARPWLVRNLLLAIQTYKRWLVSNTSPVALATEADRKQWEAPLPTSAIHLCCAQPTVHSNSNSCSPAAPPTAMLPAGGEPTFPAGTQPAPPLYRGDFTGNAGPAAAPDSGLLLAAANGCVAGAGWTLAHMCRKWLLQWCLAALTALRGFPALMCQQGSHGHQ